MAWSCALGYFLFNKPMKAANNFVIVKVIEEKKEGFNIMKNPNENNLLEGEIFSVSKDKEFKNGQRIVFDAFKSLQYTLKGQKYYFVKDETILAIL